MATLAARLLALLAALALATALRFYPFGHGWPALLLAALLPACLLLLWLRPASWLFCLPCLLPALDIAPWTGWFFIEETDLLLLLTVACGYARWPRWPGRLPGAGDPGSGALAARLGPAAWLCLLLLTLAWLTAMLRGLLPLAPPANQFGWNDDLASYLSPLNSLRLGKAWCWAMLLLPLFLRDASPGRLRRLALPGTLLGLALVTLCALWERAVFPGLSNLASDYRITAPFSAMHTGGAALDGYLALTLPLAVLWLARARRRWHTAAALSLLALALHAALVTFSRGLYAALVAAGLMALACMLHAQGKSRPPVRTLALGGLVMLALILLLTLTFGTAGYRGLAAALLLLSGAFLLSTQPLPWRLLPASMLCALVLQALLAMLWPMQAADALAGGLAGMLKAPYCLMLLSSLLLAGALWRAHVGSSGSGGSGARQSALCVAIMAWTGMACNTVWISWHWAGAGALPAAALAIAAASALLAHARLRQPLWRLGRASVSTAGAGAMLCLLAIPVSASYYAGERFTSTGGDWQGRLRHWQQALSMLPKHDAMAGSMLFGMGMGTFPRTYFWHNRLDETPARLSYAEQDGERYLRLASPAYRAGYGELLRLLQRIQLKPDTPYTLALSVRRYAALPVLQLRLCQRQLLYAQHCVGVPLRLPASSAFPTPWQRYSATVDSAWLGRGHALLRAPVQLELAASSGSQPALIEVDKLSLRGPDGRELLANGDFSDGYDYWFFSSDHHHLPWHIKNIWLHLLIESGLCSVLAMAALLGLVARRLWQGVAIPGRQAGATALLAAVSGFLVVGIFDSLLDVPRLALLFYLMLLCALLQYPPDCQHAQHQLRPCTRRAVMPGSSEMGKKKG